MGNDISCKTVSIGSIQIKIHNGTIHTLINLKYVLKIKKNLISIRTLDMKSFKCKVEGGVMQVKGKG